MRIILCSIILAAFTACSDPPLPEEGPIEVLAKEVLVPKSDLDRSPVNLQVRVILKRPGETDAAAVRRVLGAETTSDLSRILAPGASPPSGVSPEAAPEREAGDECGSTCPYAGDGECDDGRPGSVTALCGRGTDCADCSGPPVSPSPADPPPAEDPPAPDPPPADEPPASEPPRAAGCDSCEYAGDGECDDGSPGAVTSLCAPGTDCADCASAPEREAPPAAGGCDSCEYAHDGECDDGSPGAVTNACAPGTDCSDCAGESGNDDSDGAPGLGQLCDTGGASGTCQYVAHCQGEPVPGFCAGDSSVRCCVEGERRQSLVPAVVAVPIILEGIELLIVAYVAYQTSQYVGSAVATLTDGRRVHLGIYTDSGSVTDAREHGYDGGRIIGGSGIGVLTDRFFRNRAASRSGDRAQPDVRSDPGDCSYGRRDELQDLKNEACGHSFSCADRRGESIFRRWGSQGQWPSQSELGYLRHLCPTFDGNIDRGRECARRRRDVMSECYQGGDQAHRDELESVEEAIRRCEDNQRDLCQSFGL